MKKNLFLVFSLFIICIICFTVAYVTTSNIQAKKDQKKRQSSENVANNYSITYKTQSSSSSPSPIPKNEEDEKTQEPIKTKAPTPIPNQSPSEKPKTSDDSTKPSESPNKYNTFVELNEVRKIKSGVYTHPEPKNYPQNDTILEAGTEVKIIGKIGGWYKLSDGSYVFESFIH